MKQNARKETKLTKPYTNFHNCQLIEDQLSNDPTSEYPCHERIGRLGFDGVTDVGIDLLPAQAYLKATEV